MENTPIGKSKPKHLGSEMFGTKHVKTDEVVIMGSVYRENGHTSEEFAADLSFVDDCLDMRQFVHTYGRTQMKTAKGLFRKNSTYLDFVNNRLDQMVREIQLT